MRIAFILYDFDMGGMVTWVYNLATRLHRQHELHFLCTHVDRIAPKFYDVGRPIYIGQHWPRLTRYLREHHIDVVQFGQTRAFADCAFAAGVPVVIERMDGLREGTARPSTRDVDAVVASAQHTVPTFARFIDRNKIHLIYNGIDPTRYQHVRHERLGFAETDIVIGSVGRFSRVKSLELLIDAMRQLKPMYPNVKLVLAGASSKMPGANDYGSLLRARAADLRSSVVFTGQVDNPEDLIAGFDIGACVSRDEGVPNSLLECMAAGKPLVATSVGGIPELVRHEQDGLLVEDNNLDGLVQALMQLIQTPSLRAAMGMSGRLRVQEHFNLDRQAERYLTLYRTLLDHKRTASRREHWSRLVHSQRARVSLIVRPYREAVAKALRVGVGSS